MRCRGPFPFFRHIHKRTYEIHKHPRDVTRRRQLSTIRYNDWEVCWLTPQRGCARCIDPGLSNLRFTIDYNRGSQIDGGNSYGTDGA